MDIGRHGIQSPCLRPDTLGQGCIVVARQQNPWTGIARQTIEESSNTEILEGLAIEHIARDQHRINLTVLSQLRDSLDHTIALGRQLRAIFRIETAVLPADLPVCGVQNFHIPILVL
jgi:hypothetical protein